MYSVMKRRLNWSLVIGVIIIELPLMIITYWVDTADSLLLITLFSTLVLEIGFECWYLYQKKRNYAYLLLNFIKPLYIPVGLFIMLGLENRRGVGNE